MSYSENCHDTHSPSSRPPSRLFHVVAAPGRAREALPAPGQAKEALMAPGRAREALPAPGWVREAPHAPEHHYPLQPYRQTPGPITTSQTYLRTLVLERWDEACKAQLSECIQGPVTHQTYVRELIVGRWHAEKQRCQEACKVQLLELLLAAHGITTLV